MTPNPAGRMIDDIYRSLNQRFLAIATDKSVVMPNHFHCILRIRGDVGADLVSARVSVGSIVGAFKSLTAVTYGKLVQSGLAAPYQDHLWQRNYYDHIIRSVDDYLAIWRYIEQNPKSWKEDCYYE